MELPNHEGYRDPTAEIAVGRVYRLSKKKKLRFMGFNQPACAGVMSGESASASGKQSLMEKMSSVNAGRGTGESALASEGNIPYSGQNGKYRSRIKQEERPDERNL